MVGDLFGSVVELAADDAGLPCRLGLLKRVPQRPGHASHHRDIGHLGYTPRHQLEVGEGFRCPQVVW